MRIPLTVLGTRRSAGLVKEGGGEVADLQHFADPLARQTSRMR